MSFQLILCPTAAAGPTREMRGTEIRSAKAVAARLRKMEARKKV